LVILSSLHVADARKTARAPGQFPLSGSGAAIAALWRSAGSGEDNRVLSPMLRRELRPHTLIGRQGEVAIDVFGDGSVVCIPTCGHTPGHQSLRLRLDGCEVVLAADACYFCQTLRERRLPRNMYDREAMLASLDRLEALEQSGAHILFGHDLEFWRTVPQAPVPVA
jgi:glyoxylase-like metal-dependent hydrolase (beta-lactamase superfamily II)